MFFAGGIWGVADVSSVGPSLEQRDFNDSCRLVFQYEYVGFTPASDEERVKKM